MVEIDVEHAVPEAAESDGAIYSREDRRWRCYSVVHPDLCAKEHDSGGAAGYSTLLIADYGAVSVLESPYRSSVPLLWRRDAWLTLIRAKKLELRPLYVGLRHFHETFFGSVTGLETACKDVFKKCMADR